MLWKYKKCYQEVNEEIIIPTCNSRYLTSVFAVPNINGGCAIIGLSFHYTGWQVGDPLEMYIWNSTNMGEVFIIDSCIDLTTITFPLGCQGRVYFNWDDNINCCT